jgi:ParB-like chromosome segregation protein Spo0J
MTITWRNEKRKIRDLVPFSANPRQITEKQAQDLKASLERFGVVAPIIINTNNTIIGGHQRTKILEALIDVEPDYLVDVRVPDR